MWSAVRRAELCFSAAAMVMVMRQANTSSSYGGLRLATQATKELPKARTPPAAPMPLPEAPLFEARKLEDWLQPESFQYKGMLVSREPTWKDCQDVVDRAANRGDFGEDDDIKVKGVSAQEDLVAVADKLLVKVKLPEDVREAIRCDVLEVGATVRSLCPWSDSLDFKLEVIGENSCTRWHRDNYCARAIVTYNSGGTAHPKPLESQSVRERLNHPKSQHQNPITNACSGGTEYTADANVDFWELENCGTMRASSKILRRSVLLLALPVVPFCNFVGLPYRN